MKTDHADAVMMSHQWPEWRAGTGHQPDDGLAAGAAGAAGGAHPASHLHHTHPHTRRSKRWILTILLLFEHIFQNGGKLNLQSAVRGRVTREGVLSRVYYDLKLSGMSQCVKGFCLPLDYQKLESPTPDSPVHVDINVEILDILSVNDKEFSISMSMYFRWQTNRLSKMLS